MYQKQCIVCKEYKSLDDFGDELIEREGFGLICRQCLIGRLSIRYTKGFVDPNEVEVKVPYQDKKKDKALNEGEYVDVLNLGAHNKTRIDLLPLPRKIKKKFENRHIRTLGGVRFTRLYGQTNCDVNFLSKIEKEEFINIVQQYLKTQLFEPIVEKQQLFPPNRDGRSKKLQKAPENITAATLEEILNVIQKWTGVPSEDIFSKTRRQNVVEVRFLLVYFLREHCKESFPGIGRMLDRDHTTIIHSYQKGQQMIKEDPLFRKRVGFLEKQFPARSSDNLDESKPLVQKNEALNKEELRRIQKENRIKSLAHTKVEDRSLRIFNKYKNGLTYQIIASEHKLSRQRIEQIVLKTIKIYAARDILIRGKGAPTIKQATAIAKELHIAARRAQTKEKRVRKKKFKEKKWSVKYDFCSVCGSTKNKHYRNGICEVCGKRTIYGKERENIIAEHNNKCDVCSITREDAKAKYGRDFYLSRDDGSVLCRGCFQRKTGSKLGSMTTRRSMTTWSRKHDKCIICNSTEHKHYQKGKCEVCGNKPIYGKERENIIAEHNNKCDVCSITREDAKAKYGRDFSLSRENGSVLCQTCGNKEHIKKAQKALAKKQTKKKPHLLKSFLSSKFFQ